MTSEEEKGMIVSLADSKISNYTEKENIPFTFTWPAPFSIYFLYILYLYIPFSISIHTVCLDKAFKIIFPLEVNYATFFTLRSSYKKLVVCRI